MTAPGRSPLRVMCERLLLVEGRDEYNFVEALKSRWSDDSAARIQVVEAGGRTGFRARVRAILQDATTRGVTLRALGIVRDADTDGIAAWQACTTP